MESFLPSEIARLVLGYLEEQKCEDAYNIFLRSSTHLDECVKMKEEGRKFRTQVLGLSLLDILYEYSTIYSLVQERLKKVDPEALERLRHSGTLLDKITFLINSTSSGQTMLFSISLPSGNSPQTSAVAHVRKRLRTYSSNDKRKEILKKNFRNHNDNELSAIQHLDNSINLETTTLSSLPGNLNKNALSDQLIQKENYIVKTPKRKVLSSNKRQSYFNSVIPEEADENLDITALTKALLDNHELHEKIAENINKVIRTPELSNNTNVSATQDLCSAQNSSVSETNANVSNNNFTLELDDVIKKIVHDTESDPIFENFLLDVVGPPTQEETSDDYEDKGISDTSTPCKSTPETVKKQMNIRRLRSSKLKRTNSPGTSSSEKNSPNIIDHQNAVAIEGIMSVNATENQNMPVTFNTDILENMNVETEISQTITKSTTVTPSTVIPPEIPSAIPPAISTVIPNVIPTVTVANSQPVTSESVVNVCQTMTVDTTTSTISNIVNTESQQILVNNSNRNLLMLGQQSVPQSSTFVIADPFIPAYQQPLRQDNRIIFLSNKTPTIGPQFVTVQPSAFHLQPSTSVITESDILTMPTVFMCEDQLTSSGYIMSQSSYPTSTVPKIATKKNTNEKQIKKIVSRGYSNIQEAVQPSKTTQETDTIKYTISIQAEPKEQTNKIEEPPPSTSESVPRSVPLISLSSTKKVANSEKLVTPEKSTSKVCLSSPRSNRSHIRALDFSTPPKENLSMRKANTSNKSVKSPRLTTKLRSKLFISPVKSRKIPIATKSPKTKLHGNWNEELVLKHEKTVNVSKTLPKEAEDKKKTGRPRRAAAMKSQYCDKPSVIIKTKDSSEEIQRKTPKKKLDSWDQDLRVLIEPIQQTSKGKKSPIKKRIRVSQRNKEIKDKKQNVNNTEDESLSIEAELAIMEGIDLAEEVKVSKQNTEKSDTKAKKITKRKRQNSKSKTKNDEVNIEEEILSESEDSKIESDDDDTGTSKAVSTESLRNMNVRFRKKCNVDNSGKKNIVSVDDSTKQKPTEIQQETVQEMISMTVRSPSKILNTNKRTLVNQSPKDISLTEKKIITLSETESIPVVPFGEITFTEACSKITPEMFKASCSNSIVAKRNLTPILETPMKIDTFMLPITPGIFTPFSESPLTRLLGEKLDSVDLAPFLTPSFPMTPSFPITPSLQTGDTQSSYASRPTDYSNSSSYYQPSDSEQNQKLEQVLIDEAIKMQTSTLKPKHFKTSTPSKMTEESIESTHVELNIEPDANTGVIAVSQLEENLLDDSNICEKSKTLTTTQSSVDSDQYSSDTSCTSSSSCNSNSDFFKQDGTKNNETVLHKIPCRRGSKTPIKDDSTEDETVSENANNNKEDVSNVSVIYKSSVKGRIKTPIIDNLTKEEAISTNDIKVMEESDIPRFYIRQRSKTPNKDASTKDETLSENASKKKTDESNVSVVLKSPVKGRSKTHIIHNLTKEETTSANYIKNIIEESNIPIIQINSESNIPIIQINSEQQSKTSNKDESTEGSKEKPSNKETNNDSSKESIKVTAVKRRITRQSTQDEELSKEELDTSIDKHRDLKSNVTGSHLLLLKELEEKRKRTVTELENEKPSKTERKTRTAKTTVSKVSIKDRIISTRTKQTKTYKNDSKERKETNDKKVLRLPQKLTDKVEDPPLIPRKSNVAQKVSIESVAARLLKDKDNSENISTSNYNELFTSNTEINKNTDTADKEQKCLFNTNDSVNNSAVDLNQEDGLISYTPDEEEIPRLHISSDEEDHIDESITQVLNKATKQDDPELLVKELKERGIYLIPKKQIIKTNENSESSEQDKELNSKSDNINSEDGKKTIEKKSDDAKINQSKNDKIEITSDILLDKSKVIDISKIELSQGVVTDVITGNTNTTKKITKSCENISNTNTDQETDKIHTESQANSTEKQDTLEEVLDSSNTPDSLEYDFHVKVINADSSEFISITFTENNRTQKKIDDYNLGVLDKSICAKIFIDELDSWEDKHFTVTPFIELLNMLPKRKSKKTDNQKTEKEAKINLKPLQILYNELVDESSTDTAILEKEENERNICENKKMNQSENKNEKSENKNEKKSENKNEKKSENKNEKKGENKCENKNEKKCENKEKKTDDKNEKKGENKNEMKGENKNEKKGENKNEKKGENKNEKKSENKEKKIESKVKLSNTEIKNKLSNDKTEKQRKNDCSHKANVKKILSLEQYKNKLSKNKIDSSTGNKTDEKYKELKADAIAIVQLNREDDMLMTYALTGSEKILVDANIQESSAKKRKLTSDESPKHGSEKRIKPNNKHALLRTLDVDSFLTKVHGPSGKLL